MDDTTHHDLQHIVNENTSSIAGAFPEHSFERLFWEQQQQSLQLKGARSMRWHPLMIKWCLYLRHLSRKAYSQVFLVYQATLSEDSVGLHSLCDCHHRLLEYC